MTTKAKVITFIVYSAVLFASGRFLAPTKEEIKKEVVKTDTSSSNTTDNKSSDHSKDVKTKKRTKTIVRPDGTKETVVTEVKDYSSRQREDSKNAVVTTNTSTEATKESKLIERASGKTSLSVLAGVNVFAPTTGVIIYGGHIQTQLIGPFTIGIWGLSNGPLGASAGILF